MTEGTRASAWRFVFTVRYVANTKASHIKHIFLCKMHFQIQRKEIIFFLARHRPFRFVPRSHTNCSKHLTRGLPNLAFLCVYTGCGISQLTAAYFVLDTNFSAHRFRDYYINYLKYDNRQNVQRLTDVCRTFW
jgi:hypothetical protein